MFLKIYLYFNIFFSEAIHRGKYFLFFFTAAIANTFFFWNEVLMFLLYPLERSINAFENINIDKFLLENEFLETEQIGYCNIEENYENTSEVPYFEVTLLGLEESEGVFVKAHLMTVIIFSLFSVLYHIYLFVLPLLKEDLSYKLKAFIVKYTVAVLLSWGWLVPIGMNLSLLYLMSTTEEIAYYQFEIEFSVSMYLNCLFIILLIHITLPMFLFTRRASTLLMLIICILFIIWPSVAISAYITIYYLLIYFLKLLYRTMLLFYYAHRRGTKR